MGVMDRAHKMSGEYASIYLQIQSAMLQNTRTIAAFNSPLKTRIFEPHFQGPKNPAQFDSFLPLEINTSARVFLTVT